MSHAVHTLLLDRLPKLRSYAGALTRNPSSADDLVQDAAVRILTSVDRFDGVNFESWSGTILRNRFIDDCRRFRRARLIEPLIQARPVQNATQDFVVELDETMRFLEALAPIHREIITMISIEELSYERAAQRLGIPIGTVRSRLSRARLALEEAVAGGRPPSGRMTAPPIETRTALAA